MEKQLIVVVTRGIILTTYPESIALSAGTAKSHLLMPEGTSATRILGCKIKSHSCKILRVEKGKIPQQKKQQESRLPREVLGSDRHCKVRMAVASFITLTI